MRICANFDAAEDVFQVLTTSKDGLLMNAYAEKLAQKTNFK
jgi:hypothetical protein